MLLGGFGFRGYMAFLGGIHNVAPAGFTGLSDTLTQPYHDADATYCVGAKRKIAFSMGLDAGPRCGSSAGHGALRTMPNAADGQPGTNPHCWSCKAEIGPMDRFCRACGAMVPADAGKPRATLKKTGRRHAAIMFLFGIVIVLFAAVHRDPADIILVVAFGLPLCGAGAITWRMA